jgi:hypothetical protein
MEPLLAQNSDLAGRASAAGAARVDGKAPSTVGRTLAVLAAAALVLRAGDAIPGWLTSMPRGVRHCASVALAEARTGLHLGKLRDGLAGYVLTAGGIRASARPIRAVAITMGRGDAGTQLTFYRSRGGEIPATLRPSLPTFHSLMVQLRPGLSASLRAERQSDGSVWQDLEWSNGTTRTALRFNGRTVELLRLATRRGRGRR